MDLALEFGRPVSELAQMTERDLARWRNYARRRIMPTRRLELYLAQLTLMVARGPLEGAVDMTIKDFMFDQREEKPQPDEQIDMAAVHQAFQYKPRKKRK